MTIEQLRCFVAAAEHKSITKAAEVLFCSQPSVTAKIKHLEKELGITLIQRTKYGIELTPFGHKVYSDSSLIMELIDGWKSAEGSAYADELHLTMTPAHSEHIVDTLVRYFDDSNPNLNILIHELAPSEIAASILTHSSDLYLTTLHKEDEAELQKAASKANMVITTLLEDEICLFISVLSPLSARDSISLEDCKNLVLARRLIGDCIGERYHSFFAEGRRYIHNNRKQMMQFVSTHRAATFVPRLMSQRSSFYRDGEMNLVGIKDVHVPVSHVLIHRPIPSMSDSQKNAFKLIRSYYRAIGTV